MHKVLDLIPRTVKQTFIHVHTCMYKHELSAQLVFILSHQGNVDALTTLSAAVPQSVSYTRHLSVYRGSALSSSLPSNATGET